MEAQIWKSLSVSSQTAMRWASALARCRHGGGSSDVSIDVVNVFDLFVGLLLSHPDRSEPKTMLKHFRLTLGQILPENYQRPDAQTLDQNLRTIPDRAPPMEDVVAAILRTAESLHESSSESSVVEHRFVFAAMLEENNPLKKLLGNHIEQLGSTVSEVARTTREYLSDDGKVDDYAELLKKKNPIELRPVELPSYQSDHCREADLSRDLVGIRAEVDAFAYLLGSRDLNPPLAIGLFGDWGSGKSFFMKAVESRISKLTEIARKQDLHQKDVPFWKHIVQIRFNAWHYVEGELWASLVEHIFSQLKFDPNEKEDIVEERRQYWTKQITGKREELERLESDHQAKQDEQQKCQKKVADLQKEREKELQKLENLKSHKIAEQALVKSLAGVREVLEPHFEAASVNTFSDAIDSIQEAKRELRQVGTLFRRCFEGGWGAFLLVVVLILVPLLIWLLQTLDLSPVVSFLSGLGAFVAPVVVLVHRATGWVRKQRMSLQKAETEVHEEFNAKKKEQDDEIQEAEKKVTDLARDLDENRQKQADLTRELAELEKERDSITSISLTNEFIAERTGSDDYRRLLGLPALIQKDFLMLSRLVNEQNRDILEKPNQEDSPNVINRIILYIDDLDRCQNEHVIKVLQAVHLLLAFDLFVVVVAVDARWLNHALVEYYPALVDHARNGDQPTADDYLEKIFQIPFWIEPLVNDAKRSIVGGLLRAQLAGADGGDIVDQPGSPLKIKETQQQILDSMMDRAQPLSLKASDLSVSQKELDFLDSLAPVLGDTPRSVKRFVNLYQLLRIIHQSKPEDKHEIPSDHEILALVLAIGDGLPRLASPLFRSIAKANASAMLTEVIKGLAGDHIQEETKRLRGWLDAGSEWHRLCCGRLVPHAALAERFLFRVGGYLERQEDLASNPEKPMDLNRGR